MRRHDDTQAPFTNAPHVALAVVAAGPISDALIYLTRSVASLFTARR